MSAGDHRQPALPFGDPDGAHAHGPATPMSPTPSRKAAAVPDAQVAGPPRSLQAFADRWGAPDPRTAMVAACAELRSRAGQHKAPYALTPMLDALAARRATSSTGTAHGRLRASQSGWTVYTRAGSPWRRGRFTEAHEIAHILIYEAIASDPALLSDLHQRSSHDLLEHVCNVGAIELLIPAHDLAADLAARPLSDIDSWQRLYDRYLVSRTALLRRVCEVLPDTVLTMWTWREHRRGTDWRIGSSYTAHLDGLYIPNDLSRRRLNPDVIAGALHDGAVTADGTLDIGSSRVQSTMTAINPKFRAQTELPVYAGHAVGDEPADERVYLLHRNLTAIAVRRPRLPPRRAS